MISIPLFALLIAIGVGAAARDAVPVFACRADALDRTQRKRQQELLELMRRSAKATDELKDGYALRLPADSVLFQQAAEWIGLERRCCPFVQFTLEWKQDDNVWVRFTGAPGVKPFLAAEILGTGDRLP
jgi:hypothetical protein